MNAGSPERSKQRWGNPRWPLVVSIRSLVVSRWSFKYMRRLFSFLFGAGAVVMLAAVLPCFADEVAVLTNGFTIQHHRREVVGELTRLYISADGASFVDVPTADIDHYEEAPIPADPPPAKRAHPPRA